MIVSQNCLTKMFKKEEKLSKCLVTQNGLSHVRSRVYKSEEIA
jgi:hypothetical protein